MTEKLTIASKRAKAAINRLEVDCECLMPAVDELLDTIDELWAGKYSESKLNKVKSLFLRKVFKAVLKKSTVRLYVKKTLKKDDEFDDDEINDVFVECICYDVVDKLREIAKRMFKAGDGFECYLVYSDVRRCVMNDLMRRIGVDVREMHFEVVRKMKWEDVVKRRMKWVRAVKMVVKVHLFVDKELSYRVFDGLGPGWLNILCFGAVSEEIVKGLLSFGDAVTCRESSFDLLFEILNVFEVLYDVYPCVKELFADEFRGKMCCRAVGMLADLRRAAKRALCKFEEMMGDEMSKVGMVKYGEIHPLTVYVMDYVRLLVEYSDTLNCVFEDEEMGKKNGRWNTSTLRRRVLSMISSLKKSLKRQSEIYKDSGLQSIFLMRNFSYMVQIIEDSDIGELLGDDWIPARRGLTKNGCSNFRVRWTNTLSCLMNVEGSGGRSSIADINCFNTCFENVRKNI